MLYIFGESTLDTYRYELSRAGRIRRLRRKAFQVLAYLLVHPDRVIAKQELREQVWPQQFISDAALESTMKAVRQAIGDSGHRQQLIQTVYGSGYRFIVPVEERPTTCPLRRGHRAASQTSSCVTGEWLMSTPMPNTHISSSATLSLLLCLQAAARFLGRPQLLTRT